MSSVNFCERYSFLLFKIYTLKNNLFIYFEIEKINNFLKFKSFEVQNIKLSLKCSYLFVVLFPKFINFIQLRLGLHDKYNLT